MLWGFYRASCDVSEQLLLNLLQMEPRDVVRFFIGWTSSYKESTIKSEPPLLPLLLVLLVWDLLHLCAELPKVIHLSETIKFPFCFLKD